VDEMPVMRPPPREPGAAQTGATNNSDGNALMHSSNAKEGAGKGEDGARMSSLEEVDRKFKFTQK